MSKTLGVSRSGFYAWRERAVSARSKADAALTERIKAIHKASSETYGAPRIHAELIDDGVRVGRKRVGDCRIFCARGRFRHWLTNLSPKTTANWVLASNHSRGGRFHSSAAWLRTRYSSFIAASSLGKWPRVRTARRSFEFSASMAFVV